MSNNVWTTTIMFDENYRVFGLTFPDKFDYLEFYKLKEDTVEEKKHRLQLLDARIEITKRYHLAEKILSENAPTILYAHGFGKTVQLPSFFRTQEGFVILTEACANGTLYRSCRHVKKCDPVHCTEAGIEELTSL